MFGNKKSMPAAPKRPAAKRSLAQFGLMDMSDITADDADINSDDDNDLESELLALTSGETPKPRTPSRPLVNQAELNRMIQDGLRDIPSDEEVSSGEDDPSLLAELLDLQVEHSPTESNTVTSNATSTSSLKTTLLERLKMYEIAEQNAKNANDASKARRMTRGISNLKNLIKKVDMGVAISEDDIPPVVSNSVSKVIPAIPPRPNQNEILNVSDDSSSVAPPVPPRTVKHGVPSSSVSNDEPEPKMKPSMNDTLPDHVNEESPLGKSVSKMNNLEILKLRQDEYKKVALEAKRRGDTQTALNYVKVVKQLEQMIHAATDESIDLTSIPPPPSNDFHESCSANPVLKDESELQHDLPLTSNDVPRLQPTNDTAEVAESYTVPKTVMEALEQRLKKYQETEEAAKREENSSKVRRMGRIVQQYKNAIQMHKAGKPIPVDELPTPPGFAPIPVNEPPKTSAIPPQTEMKPAPVKTSPAPPTISKPNQSSTNALSRSEKQLRLLTERQKLFKVAALKAKQDGNLDLAKEYLKSAKGFDPLIEASKCGLPVDFSSLPLPPNEKQALESTSETSYEVVRLNDCIEGTDLDVFHKLISDLQHQLEMCMKTRDHFKAMGDIANANRLEQLASQTKKDLKFIQLAELSNLRVPKFHYETKPFTIVQCNTDLTDNDVEVTVVQGINYNVPNPKAVDTYVKLYFPYPTENSQQYKTAVIYDTNNPSYNSTTTFTIQRNARACKRIFMRNALKCEVWSKNSPCSCFSGIFRSDSLVGTVNMKLQPLETQCTVHDAYDLMDGRRAVGGKLELKVRMRDPIVKKQVEHIEEKWLIIDS